MSQKHPIIAVTGSSGSGSEPVATVFKHLFWREKVTAVTIQGEGFHRYDRNAMKKAVEKFRKAGQAITHFGPESNLLERQEAIFQEYGKKGTGEHRRYLHNAAEAAEYQQSPGTFTPWEAFPKKSDLLFYQGLHGGFASPQVNIARHVDLLIGVTPIINLEWIQKIHRDTAERGYSAEAVTDTILRRMSDYVHFITPQFSRTHINFQRVPVVDTSNPFISRDVPTLDESFMVIRFRFPKEMDFPDLLNRIPDSFMSRPNSIVIPAGKTMHAMEIILLPFLHRLMEGKRSARA